MFSFFFFLEGEYTCTGITNIAMAYGRVSRIYIVLDITKMIPLFASFSRMFVFIWCKRIIPLEQIKHLL